MDTSGQPQTAVTWCQECGLGRVTWMEEYRIYSECPECGPGSEFSRTYDQGGVIHGACQYCTGRADYIICHGDGTATLTVPVCEECKPFYQYDLVNSPRHGFVYLVDSQVGYFKIGRSREPVERFRKFDVMLPYDMMVIALIETKDMYKLEKELHWRFAESRVRGEWFALNPQQVLFIKRMAEVQP